MKYVLYAILAYLAYQLIFNLVIPVYKASKRIKKGFREMHSQMQEQMNRQQAYSPTPSAPTGPSPNKPSSEDYIEFEEVD